MNMQLLSQGGGPSAGVVIGAFLLFVVVAVVVLIAKLIVVGNPSEMLIIAGGRQRDGQGYSVLIGGRRIVIPIVNKVSRISLRNMQVALEVKAQAGGGTMVPIQVNGVANVKVSSNPTERANAIERFLGEPAQELQRVARETLEGGLRAVIGKMTPQEIVEDRDKFVETVMNEVTDDFRKLGMVIDSVNIQNVHDEHEYLSSIARKATAEVIASARKTEADQAAQAVVKEAEANASARGAKAARDAQAKQVEAESRQKAEEARLGAEKSIAEAENALRIRKAELAREAAIKEAEQQEAAAKAEEQRLNATEVAAANAQRDIAMAKAEGDAASVLEEGKARAAAIEQIGEAIQGHPDALKVMLLELMPGVVDQVAQSVNNMAFGEVTVIDGGNGHAIAGAAMGRARALSESLAMVENILGVDLKGLSKDIASGLTNRAQNGSDDGAHGPAQGKGPRSSDSVART